MRMLVIQQQFGFDKTSEIPEFDAKEDFDLEEVFAALNGMGNYAHLRSFIAYSLSVGDIVGLAPNNGDYRYYLVEPVGWKEIDRIDIPKKEEVK